MTYKRADEAAEKAHAPKPKHAGRPVPASWGPAALYNGMVAPAVEYGVKGAIWYQGESNAGVARAPIYDKVFAAMITDWRRHWQQGGGTDRCARLSTAQAIASVMLAIQHECGDCITLSRPTEAEVQYFEQYGDKVDKPQRKVDPSSMAGAKSIFLPARRPMQGVRWLRQVSLPHAFMYSESQMQADGSRWCLGCRVR